MCQEATLPAPLRACSSRSGKAATQALALGQAASPCCTEFA